MEDATITFANGTTLAVHNDELMFGVTFNKASNGSNPSKEEFDYLLKTPETASRVDAIEMWSHSDAGLFVALADLTHNYEYFGKQDNPTVFYKSSSVVEIKIY